ncbi:helix-turn-helix domain-containing protein [Sphingosinicella sp. LHD-64]|uniref:winged helix-turn-helix transcriptional regulator n=1 Tax=Sphingosinicella sp. LHD-64 TaxID=3072139 RepID=UPI00280D43CC|nr:helix-turn-helix domain-containing protein [Sphingosinicella sp. LHD-64]MDQ8756348.1 helix-turn-helix domain-containing protein [Sphingosinicella sp. LHD-64]
MKRLKSRYGCPVELAIEFVGGKWKTVILAWLKEAPHRYSDLRARIPGISEKVLTQRLKDLEMLGLVERTRGEGGQAVSVYRLTALGESLRPMLDALYEWGDARANDLSISVR